MEMQIYWFQKQMHFHKVNMIAIKCQVNQEVFLILLSLIDHQMKVLQANIILELRDILNQYMNYKLNFSLKANLHGI